MCIRAAGTPRIKYVTSPIGVVDLLAVLPFWLMLVLPAELKVLLVFRMVRFLKLARYSPGMRSLLEALYTERRALLGCLVILVGATLLAASIMHLVERDVQPEKLGTIPNAMWWAIVTLGTVGYGDVVPMTPLGRVVASATIFLGLVMAALPVGIIATAFANQVHRRDFVITWSMVARVPLFAELTASEIADIMQLLRSQQVEAGVIIARRGDVAQSMYFIADGEVEIELKDKHIRLGRGHFFGEVAALRRARRSATATAVTRTSLLVLDAHDLHTLMDREPRIAERIRDVVRSRLGREVLAPRGYRLRRAGRGKPIADWSYRAGCLHSTLSSGPRSVRCRKFQPLHGRGLHHPGVGGQLETDRNLPVQVVAAGEASGYCTAALRSRTSS